MSREHHPRPGAKFCEECAAPLQRLCTSCGSELRPIAKLCGECGSPTGDGAEGAKQKERPFRGARAYTPKHLADKILTSRSALEGERKQVTVLFADVKGSMELLHQQNKKEEARRMLAEIYRWFSEGFDTADPKEAKTFLEELSGRAD